MAGEQFDDEFYEKLQDLLRNRPTGSRTGGKAKQDEFNVSELPEFVGGTNQEDYLEWERRINRLFDFKDLSDEKRCKYALLRLSKGASLWYEGLKARRSRTGKEKLSSWESLKRKLRKRYVPATHKLGIYRKIADFMQEKLSVAEYIDEFEKLILMGELEENEEQKMSRFLRGLNRKIANYVELYPYPDFDTLCNLCIKIESQGKFKSGGSSREYSGPNNYSKPVQIAPLLARSNLLITRDIEWMNLMLGFEQENRYAIVDVCYPHSPVGLIREESNVLLRQFLRLRRPFTAYITDALGNEIFRYTFRFAGHSGGLPVQFMRRRLEWYINDGIFGGGSMIYTWSKLHNLYYPGCNVRLSSVFLSILTLGYVPCSNKQFAVVENPGLWCWTFTLKDINGDILAQIDRDWRGFGFEIFTDAGQYVIRFGSSDSALKAGPGKEVEELEIARPLTLSERAVVLALAVSLDNDYFSRHGGWGIPFVAVTE
ncbi:hypothetical protein KSS87_020133 [Heliosperma pusillum]|nr:hypothetical protein KSS87_020133 [Heliosperma pusillum]